MLTVSKETEMRAVLQHEVERVRKESVGLLLRNGKGKFFCIKELDANPEYGKEVGHRSFPWETKKGEESNDVAMARLLLEEIDATGQLVTTEPVFIGKMEVHGTLAHIYYADLICIPENARGSDAGKEVEPQYWKTREFITEEGQCRDGVPEGFALLDAYVAPVSEPEQVSA